MSEPETDEYLVRNESSHVTGKVYEDRKPPVSAPRKELPVPPLPIASNQFIKFDYDTKDKKSVHFEDGNQPGKFFSIYQLFEYHF